ncbi:hypothetical protein CEXT_510851 [Caerostris extrusa]|uniref:Uncharacterized protein n=1 Tax=Caerostris extrusa TaxID=172846 RepID=A0AAV4XL41_CAEEX|nr:hypothetical protein CEXT_510851 [Caerostris extrusa]
MSKKDTQVVSKTDSSETVTTEILKSPPEKKSDSHVTEETEETETIDGTPIVTKTVTTVIRKIVTSGEDDDESYTTMTTTSDEQKDTQVVSKTDSSETVTTEVLKSPSGEKSPRLTCNRGNRRDGNNRWDTHSHKDCHYCIRKIVTSDEGDDESIHYYDYRHS